MKTYSTWRGAQRNTNPQAYIIEIETPEGETIAIASVPGDTTIRVYAPGGRGVIESKETVADLLAQASGL